MLPPVTDPFALVNVFVGLMEIKDGSMPSSRATTCDTFIEDVYKHVIWHLKMKLNLYHILWC